eukprot:m.112655 g.112655  ORF g.112655 m.112655 type:complete len:328 (-) comp22837_c0_seq3:107-1090(-)
MSSIKMIRTLWGNPLLAGANQWDSMLAQVKKDGFHGVEVAVVAIQHEPEKWQSLLQKHGLCFVGQVHTCGYVPLEIPKDVENPPFPQSYVPSADVDEHIDSLRKLATLCKQCGAEFVNSHSGHDSWNAAQGTKFFRAALEIEKEVGISISHETHRRRLLFTPWQAKELLTEHPDIKTTADLSHWVVVLSRVPHPTYDKDWPEIMRLVAERTRVIHARVGYREGPQVPDPSAPEFEFELKQHISWWDDIVTSARTAGRTIYIEPEWGPAPYQHTLPFTKQEVAEIDQINVWMARHLEKHYTNKGFVIAPNSTTKRSQATESAQAQKKR